MLTTALLLALSPTTVSAPGPQSGQNQAPPGMVFIKGGRTKIGIDAKTAQQIGEENEEIFAILARETGAKESNVPDFFLGVTEVTNEQYLEFVTATGARPPESWGIEAINEATRAWAEDQGKQAKEAREKGLDFERRKFDQANWWRRNWQDSTWKIPEGEETMPVAYIDYQEAEAYARWAGVRLMTEFEYQRAGRGGSEHLYPWGEEWNPDACANQDQRLRKARPVGSYPAGATSDGVHDLAGNVWEWTASPFTPYEKWKVLKIEVGERKAKRTIDAVVAWDANQRVAVGGSFQLGSMAARLTTRRGSERTQSTEGLGFRVAASTTPGLDIAETVVRQDLPTEVRPDGIAYDLALAVGIDRWNSKEGTATTVSGGDGRVPIENYSIITGYDYILVAPVDKVAQTSTNALDKESHKTTGPVHLGMISTTQDILEPELPAGTYMLTYRGSGKLADHEAIEGGIPEVVEGDEQAIAVQDPQDAPDDEGDEDEEMAPTITYPEGFDPEAANVLMYDTAHNLVAAIPVGTFEYSKPTKPTVLVADSTRTIITGYDDKDNPITEEEPITQVTMRVNTPGKVKSRVFAYNLVLNFKPGQIGKDWRR